MGCQGNLQSENVAIFGILSGGSRRAREWERYGYDFAGISTYNGKPETADQERIMHHRDIYNETLKYFLHPISSLLNDPEVSEVLVNGYETVFFEKGGKLYRSECRFPDEAFLTAAARNIAEYVGRQVGGEHHSMDARLPDGSRVHVIVAPSSRQGTCLSIRKFKKSSFNLETLVQWGSISPEVSEFLRLAVIAHRNIVISGGTGTGKTSLLNALSSAIPEHERIIVIEDSSELQLHQPHTLYLEAQPGSKGRKAVTIRDLFVDSLRMRPDRIVVGEVRRGEALDLVQSMISGHEGSLTTVHANTPRDSAVRLETLCMLSDVSLPAHVARVQVASAIQLVVQIARLGDGSRRVMTISECLGLDGNNDYIFRDLYRFRGQGMDGEGRVQGSLVWTGEQPVFADSLRQMGLDAGIRLTQKLFETNGGASPD